MCCISSKVSDMAITFNVILNTCHYVTELDNIHYTVKLMK